MTDTAEEDLAEIWAYIATEASESTATNLLARIEDHWARLRDFPLSGVARDRLRAGLRVVFHSSYAIYYIVADDEVVIIRVLHSLRDAAALAEQGGFL